jgi:hypothetical protein
MHILPPYVIVRKRYGGQETETKIDSARIRVAEAMVYDEIQKIGRKKISLKYEDIYDASEKHFFFHEIETMMSILKNQHITDYQFSDSLRLPSLHRKRFVILTFLEWDYWSGEYYNSVFVNNIRKGNYVTVIQFHFLVIRSVDYKVVYHRESFWHTGDSYGPKDFLLKSCVVSAMRPLLKDVKQRAIVK